MGIIRLDGAVGSSGRTIFVTSSNAAAKVPANVVIATGTAKSFTITTTVVTAQTVVTITAKSGSIVETGTLTINP